MEERFVKDYISEPLIPVTVQDDARDKAYCRSCVILSDKIIEMKSEFSSYQDRIEKRRTESEDIEKRKVILSFLPVFDSIVLALNMLDGKDVEYKGIKSIGQQFINVLKIYDIEYIYPDIGEPFNPEIHEALAVRTDFQRDNTIAEVLSYGFKYKDKLIRPASVKVFKK